MHRTSSSRRLLGVFGCFGRSSVLFHGRSVPFRGRTWQGCCQISSKMTSIWRLRRLKQRWHDEVFLRDILAAVRKGLACFRGRGRFEEWTYFAWTRVLCHSQPTSSRKPIHSHPRNETWSGYVEYRRFTFFTQPTTQRFVHSSTISGYFSSYKYHYHPRLPLSITFDPFDRRRGTVSKATPLHEQMCSGVQSEA